MNLLPVATPAAPANGTATETAALAGSGDFAALVAMLTATASTTLPIQRPPAESAGIASDAPTPVSVAPLPASATPARAFPASVPGRQGSVPAAAAAVAASERSVPADFAPVSSPTSDEPAGGEASPPAEPVMAAPSVPGPPAAPLPEDSAAPVGEMPPAPPALPAAARRTTKADENSSGSVSGRDPDDGAPVPAPAPPLRQPAEVQPAHHDSPVREVRVAAVAIELTPVLGPTAGPLGLEPRAAEKADGLPAPKINATPSSSAGAATPVVPLVAVTRSEALIPAEAPAATPVVMPAVPEQIVSAVVPLHGRGDGRHEVTLELRPDHLGTIRVEVSVEHQTVHLTLHAAEPGTSRLLAAALPDLRTALADAGLTPGHLGVGPDAGSGTGQWRKPSGTGGSERGGSSAARRGDPTSDDPEPVRSLRPATAGRLDLFL